jgi:predicted tellurium resistance membrane protein TerC
LIVVGAEIIHRFQGVFFIFAAFLFFTAWKVWSGEDEEPDPDTNRMVTFISARVPTTTEYDGSRLITKINGKRFLTPLAMVMLAIGTTDLLFALDSIPAVFGITSEAYLVFAANAFALMGLRQLYFLIRDLITKLRHLNKGIALILVFIGIKLLLEAKADVNHKGFLNCTALTHACTNGNEAAVKLLIAAKADVNSADENGYAALIKAIHRPGIVKLLIEAKADVNRANSRGYTALMMAIACVNVSENSLAVVKLLLAVPGIDIDHAGIQGETALSLAKAPKFDDEDEDEDPEDEEEYHRRLSLVPLLEEKMRQQAIDAEVAAAVKRIDDAAAK